MDITPDRVTTPGKEGQRPEGASLFAGNGFTLVELLLVVLLIAMLAALAVSYGAHARSSAAGAERALAQLEECLIDRRGAAIRLQPLGQATSLEPSALPPLDIDFTNLADTAALVTDADPGQPVTAPMSGSWQKVYTGSVLQLPVGWRVATQASDLGNIPLIATGARARGLFITRVGFDGRGCPWVNYNPTWVNSIGPGSPGSAIGPDNAPFWAVYVVNADRSAAMAVGLHPAGLLEAWRWTGATWVGFRQRTVSGQFFFGGGDN